MAFYEKFIPDHLRVEIEFLIHCTRTFIDGQDNDYIRHFDRKSINWNYLFQISIKHRVLPIVYQSLSDGDFERVPGEIVKRLSREYSKNSIRNLYLAGELFKIMDMLAKEKIDCIPFKGPVTAEYIFGDIALRQFNDLDILVHREDVLKAFHVLVENGYRSNVIVSKIQSLIQTCAENAFIRNDDKVVLELHWEMLNNYLSCGMYLNDLENSFKSFTLAGRDIKIFKAEELLFYLCVHGTKDGWGVLELICCIAKLLKEHSQIRWERVFFMAKRMHCERMVYLSLFIVSDVYRIKLPKQVKKKIFNDLSINNPAATVYEKLFREDKKQSGLTQKIKEYLYHLNLRDRPADKIRYSINTFVKPKEKDLKIFDLPSRFLFMYYILRPVRLCLKWILRIIVTSQKLMVKHTGGDIR